jgi:hypothetical protein
MPYSDEIIINMLTKIATQLDEVTQRLQGVETSHASLPGRQSADQPTYIDKRVAGGGPAFIKAGKRVLYRTDALFEYLNDRMVAHTLPVVD